MKTQILMVFMTLIVFATTTNAQETEATRLLKEQNKELVPEIFKFGDNVWFAVGHDVSNVAMIEGETGIILIDAGQSPVRMEALRQKFREITDKPVKAIFITHGHGDHFGGIQAFLDEGDNPQVWGRKGALGENTGFNIEARAGKMAGLTYFFTGEHKKIEIDGISFELVAASGETYDNMYVYMPDEKVLFTGDTYYKSFPNLYTIRGSQYRDVQSWYQSIEKMLGEDAEYLLPGHTRPVIGKRKGKGVPDRLPRRH